MMGVEVYAVVDSDGNVISTSLWDGETEWEPPEGTEAFKTGDSGAGIGWTYKDGTFTPPPVPEIPKEDLVAQANQQKASLTSEASQTISILQDAVDLDMATDEEKAQLTAWKKYRVLLSRVDTSTAPDIAWPEMS
nr:tail fiber assembly protein [Pantoea sp. YU22]